MKINGSSYYNPKNFTNSSDYSFTNSSISSAIANTITVFNSSKNLVSSSISSTQLNYLSNVTSDIQSQLNLKAPLASPSFTGTINTPLTASCVIVTDSSSNLSASSITTDTLAFLDATSSIQTQLNNKASTYNTLVNNFQ